MDELNKAGKIEYEKTKKLTELKYDHYYKVKNAKVISTRYGPSIIILVEGEEEDFRCFLPKRFSSLGEEALEALSDCYFTLEKEEGTDFHSFKFFKEIPK